MDIKTRGPNKRENFAEQRKSNANLEIIKGMWIFHNK